MAQGKQGIGRAEVHELIDTRIRGAIREVTWLVAMVVPELMKLPRRTAEDREKLAAALRAVVETQMGEGRVSAATAAAAFAEALEAQARKG